MARKRSGNQQESPQDTAEQAGTHELTDEPQTQQQTPAAEQQATAAPVNTEAKLDELRNAIEGCQLVINHLRATGTGQSKLAHAEDHIKSLADRLCGSDIKPVKRDLNAMKRGAVGLVEAMTVGDEATVPPAWTQPTADKATAFINSQAFK